VTAGIQENIWSDMSVGGLKLVLAPLHLAFVIFAGSLNCMSEIVV
jgi:hypothetical protein